MSIRLNVQSDGIQGILFKNISLNESSSSRHQNSMEFPDFTPSITLVILSSRWKHGIPGLLHTIHHSHHPLVTLAALSFPAFSHHPSLLSSSRHHNSMEFPDFFTPSITLIILSSPWQHRVPRLLHTIHHSHHPLITPAARSSLAFFMPSITLIILSSPWQHGVP